jgi:putative heme-binding domain-containing protein
VIHKIWGIRVSALILASGVLLAQGPPGGGNAAAPDLTAIGDATRGQAIVEGKGNCLSCHRIKNVGSRTGPDLSEIGARRPAQLQTKLLAPDTEIGAANRPYRVTLKNGTVVNGRLLNEDTFTVQLMDDKENLRNFIKSDLRDYVFVEKSPMPSYKDKLSSTEVADVIGYLGTLRPPPGAGGGRGGGVGGGRGAAAAPPAAGAARGPAAPVEPPH